MTRAKYLGLVALSVLWKVTKLSGVALAFIFAGIVWVTVGLMAWLIRDSFTGRY